MGAFAPRALPPGMPNRDYMPVVVPNGTKCPWKVVNGVKVFHLVAEEFEHEFAPGLKATCWGYNKQVNGPILEMVEGDHVRIYLTNRLIAPPRCTGTGSCFQMEWTEWAALPRKPFLLARPISTSSSSLSMER